MDVLLYILHFFSVSRITKTVARHQRTSQITQVTQSFLEEGIRKIEQNFQDLPSLIEINNEHDVIPETGQAVSGGHDDYKCEHIVNERIERLQRQLQI